jgi:L-alanine-DL-glutamate epimerase-like enolase superfamily enzyme
MKVGRDNLREDIERVAAVREHVGKNFRIMVDANMRWSVDQAIRAARALYEYDLYWVEEPIIPEDINGHVQVIKEGRLPIATGENFHSIYEFKHIIAAGGVSFPEPDVATIGGITPWMKIAALAESYNLPITSHGVHDIHVQLLAAIPNASYLEVHGFDLNEFIKSPLEFVDGNALAPDNPGHGVEFDRKSLESYLV